MEHSTRLQILSEVSQSVIYIIGSSFVAGSAVTLLIFVILDFVHRNKEKRKQ